MKLRTALAQEASVEPDLQIGIMKAGADHPFGSSDPSTEQWTCCDLGERHLPDQIPVRETRVEPVSTEQEVDLLLAGTLDKEDAQQDQRDCQ